MLDVDVEIFLICRSVHRRYQYQRKYSLNNEDSKKIEGQHRLFRSAIQRSEEILEEEPTEEFSEEEKMKNSSLRTVWLEKETISQISAHSLQFPETRPFPRS